MSGGKELLRCHECGAEPVMQGEEQTGYKMFCSESGIHNSCGDWFQTKELAEADWNRRQREAEQQACPENLGSLLQPCPFCGKKMKFYREQHTNRFGEEYVHQYYMHDAPPDDLNTDCVLDAMPTAPFCIPAGDARPEEGYIGEYAEKWNKRAFIMLPKTK